MPPAPCRKFPLLPVSGRPPIDATVQLPPPLPPLLDEPLPEPLLAFEPLLLLPEPLLFPPLLPLLLPPLPPPLLPPLLPPLPPPDPPPLEPGGPSGLMLPAHAPRATPTITLSPPNAKSLFVAMWVFSVVLHDGPGGRPTGR